MPTKQEFAEAKSKMVAKLLSMGYDYFRIPPSPRPSPQGEGEIKRWQVCMDKLDDWFINGGHAPYTLRKGVRTMSHNNLTEAVTIFSKVYNDYLKKI